MVPLKYGTKVKWTYRLWINSSYCMVNQNLWAFSS